MEITDTRQMEWEQLRVSSRNMRTSRKLLRDGEVLPGMGLYALLVKLHDGDEMFTAPRHRHNFAQIRIGLRGHMNFGPNLECDPGEVGFFPGGAYYGPEEINGAEYLLIQWGREWVTRKQDKAAMDELARRGRFEHGKYYSTDGSGEEVEVDGKRAVWEHVYGRPEVIRPPRYRAPIMMAPDSFDWIKGDGVSSKVLGRFTEDDITVQMVRWDGIGAHFELDADRTWLMWVQSGLVTVGGVDCRPETAVWSDYNETHSVLGTVGSEVIVVGFPLDRERS